MDSLIFAINAVAPIIIMVATGYLLKKLGFMDACFAKAANKLVFRAFLPAMLFLNIYKMEDFADIELSFIGYAIGALLTIFTLSVPLVILATRKNERRGVLLQASFRSNYALIGIPLASSLFGDEGVAVATLLSAIAIPMFNILAVISLSMFNCGGKKPNIRKILFDIIKNPLIQSVVIGVVTLFIRMLFANKGIAFRLSDITPLYTVLEYLSKLATPLALLVLGAQFEFSAVSELRREIVLGTLLRVFFVPLFGLGTAYLLFASHFTGAHFAALVAMFATPVAVSSVPMAQEMGNDAALAGQLVVWTTIVSTVTIFAASLILKLAGIF